MWKNIFAASAMYILMVAGSFGQSITPDQLQTLRLMDAVQNGRTRVGRYDQLATVDTTLGSRTASLAKHIGFDARVFRDRYSQETLLIYRASDPLTTREGVKDWVLTNGPQFAGLQTPSYNVLGPIMARTAVERYGATSCGGWSQGGGLASVSCSPLGLKTTTANSAGLSFVNQITAHGSAITNFRMIGDPVSSGVFGKLQGRIVNFGSGLSGFTHDIAPLISLAERDLMKEIHKELQQHPQTGRSLSVNESRMPEGMGLAFGSSCLDYYRLGETASCKDGSYTSPQDRVQQEQQQLQQLSPPMFGGCPPGDPARCWWR